MKIKKEINISLILRSVNVVLCIHIYNTTNKKYIGNDLEVLIF